MSTPTLGLGQRAVDLRRAFDQAFAEPPPTSTPETMDLLAIRIAGDPYALRMSELTGLVSSRKVVPLPSRRPDLLGVVGIRGGLVSVYSLASLVGYGPSTSPARWLALSGATDPVALAFEKLEGFLRVRRADVHGDVEASKQRVTEVVRFGTVTRRIVDVRSTVAALKAGAGASGSTKER